MAQGDRVNWSRRTGATTAWHWWGPSLILLLLAVHSAAPEEEEDGGMVTDFRRVSYESLVHNMDQFTETGVTHFSEILFDVKRYQLIVGARDALFR